MNQSCKTVVYFRGECTNLYELTCTVTRQPEKCCIIYTRPEFSSQSPENPAPDLATVQHTIDQGMAKGV
jgi:hypothetical protein